MRNRLLSTLRAFIPPTLIGRTIFLVLLAIGVFLRVAGLTWGIPDFGNQSSIYHDEGHVLSFVLKSPADFKKDFGEYEIVRPVYLYRLLGRPLITAGDYLGLNSPDNRTYELAALRSITAAFGIGGLLAIYALGKQIASHRTGLWAMAALTFMPAHWYYSQILKGDVMVATLFTLLLLCAIRIARRGDWPAYLWGALILGVGTSFKATTIMAAPVLLLAHLIFAAKQKRLTAFFSRRSLLAVILAAISFAVLYPYPFYDYAQYIYLIQNPSMQHLTPKLLVSPATYLATINQYHSPTRPFFEMIFGKFLLWAFLPSLAVVLLATGWHVVKKRRFELLLIIVLFALFFHSLTFSDALDERYILPFAPFAALFPALVVSGFGRRHHGASTYLGALVGTLLVAGTAAITLITFPIFAFEDPRQQAVAWIHARAPEGATIAQASQTSRWALVFDSSKYKNMSFLYGPETSRHLTELATPDYLIIQQEPWNYDHTFRYELAGVDRQELDRYVNRYQDKRTFGRVPMLLGWPIPQTLGTPVIHVYESPIGLVRQHEQPRVLPADDLERPIANGSFVPIGAIPSPGSYVRVELAASASVPEDAEGDVYIGLSPQDTFVSPELPERLEEPAVIQTHHGATLFYRLSMADLRNQPSLALVVHVPRPNQAVFYREADTGLAHVGQTEIDGASQLYLFSIVPPGQEVSGSFVVEHVYEGEISL